MKNKFMIRGLREVTEVVKGNFQNVNHVKLGVFYLDSLSHSVDMYISVGCITVECMLCNPYMARTFTGCFRCPF